MSMTPIGMVPIANEPVWLLSAEPCGADAVRLTLQRTRTYVEVMRRRELAWIPLAEKRRPVAARQTQQRTRTWERVVTLAGWAAVRRVLVRLD